MASYGSRSPSPPANVSGRRMKTCARRCERACCAIATYFPLAFVYSITTWAVWVDARIGFHRQEGDKQIPYSKKIPSAIGVILYILLNASYTIAVFTDPGSPNDSDPSQKRGKYSVLPTSEPHDQSDVQTITVSSSGSARFCKKCHVSKPDRTHHCSTCKRCVLKMDHHCPWLATCLGLHNYKAFVLFLIYVSLFCWACLLNTGFWIWHEIFEANKYLENFAPVNVILLAVLSGIIGLVISGFTGWHLYLCIRGQTTIECLEKTRYLSGVRRQVEANRQEHANSHSRHGSESLANNLKRIGDQVLEFHANAVPGASRFEEGEEHTSPAPTERRFSDLNHMSTTPPHHQSQTSSSDSPAQRALRTTYQAHEQQRESDRYEEYLLDQDSSKLPNAFDLGWRRNLAHVFGPSPFLWWLPVCNSTGDGWRWEVSENWVRANEEVTRQREERLRNAQQAQQQQQYASDQTNIRGGGMGRYYDDNSNNNSYNSYTSYDYQNKSQYQHPDPATNSFPARSYNDSALSMHTLHRPQSGSGAGKMRRDFDRGGADGEVGHFEVSGSEGEEESDSDEDIGQMGSRSRRGRSRENDEWGGTW